MYHYALFNVCNGPLCCNYSPLMGGHVDWFQQINAYCERADPSYWAEPVNAVTNLAFIIAAFIMWHRCVGMPFARGLSAIVFVIGAGSYLFHTHAQTWAAAADVGPIAVFILVYLFGMNRQYLHMRPWVALWATLLFLPYAALAVPLFARLDWLGSSAGYAPVPLGLLAYVLILRKRAPETARGVAIGGLLLVMSLMFRTVDPLFCETLPLGTHFLWHLINGVMLAWMIEVYRRHRLADGQTQG